ncbi:hypothetical protein COBT_002216 [Conglomerata obtusa]
MFVSIFLIYVKTSSSEDDNNLDKTVRKLTRGTGFKPQIDKNKDLREFARRRKDNFLTNNPLKKTEVRQISSNTNNSSAEGNNYAASDKNTKGDMLPSSTINFYKIKNLHNAELIKETRSNLASIEFAMNDLLKRLTLTEVKNLVETAKNNILEELFAKLAKLENESEIIIS